MLERHLASLLSPFPSPQATGSGGHNGDSVPHYLLQPGLGETGGTGAPLSCASLQLSPGCLHSSGNTSEDAVAGAWGWPPWRVTPEPRCSSLPSCTWSPWRPAPGPDLGPKSKAFSGVLTTAAAPTPLCPVLLCPTPSWRGWRLWPPCILGQAVGWHGMGMHQCHPVGPRNLPWARQNPWQAIFCPPLF